MHPRGNHTPISALRSCSCPRLVVSLLFSRESPSTMCWNFSTSRRSSFSRSCSCVSASLRAEYLRNLLPHALQRADLVVDVLALIFQLRKAGFQLVRLFLYPSHATFDSTQLAFDVVNHGVLRVVVVTHEEAVRLAHVRVENTLACLLAVETGGLRCFAVLKLSSRLKELLRRFGSAS